MNLPLFVVPTIATIIIFMFAYIKCYDKGNTYFFPDVFTVIFNLIKVLIATIASLLCWLSYFIIF